MSDAPTPLTDLAQFAQERDALLRRIVATLEADAHVRAAGLSGSFGRGEADEWADFDLHVAVADAGFAAFLDERRSLYARVGVPVLIQREMPSDSMPGGWFQLVNFAGPFEVDWNIGPVSEAVRPLAYQMLIEREQIPIVAPPSLSSAERRERAEDRLTFFWAMAPIAVKLAGRTETRRAIRQIDLLSHALIALWRLVHQPEGPEPLVPASNRVLERELNAQIPRLGVVIDPLACLTVIRAHCAAVERLHPALAAIGVSLPSAMPGQVAALIAIAESAARRGDPRERVYR